MNTLYMLLAIPLLAIINALLTYYAFILYKRSYEQHVSLEPSIPLSKAKSGIIANAIIGFFHFPLGPLFVFYSKNLHTDGIFGFVWLFYWIFRDVYKSSIIFNSCDKIC